MATMKANGKLVVFTARKPSPTTYAAPHEVRVMVNGAGLRPRWGGGFKKVRSVAASRGLTFAELADVYTDAGWVVTWDHLEFLETKPKPLKRRPRLGSAPFYAGVE